MKVGKIGHAGLAFIADGATVLMDPVLVSPFEGGVTVHDPPFTVDVSAVPCDAIILSHSHFDHFSVASLHKLPRDVPVLYPAGAELIETALKRLGFSAATPLAAGVTDAGLGPFQIEATASRVPFPECGILIRADGQTVWNGVDTVLDDDVRAAVLASAPSIDVAFAMWQPIVEEPLSWNALGGERFPVDEYGELLKNVFALRPRCVVPGSCGLRFGADEWVNWRYFPTTEEQFLADVAAVMPGARQARLAPGDLLDVGTFDVARGGLTWVRPLTDARGGAYAWHPERGVPPMSDHNLAHYPVDVMRGEINAFLDALPATYAAAEHRHWTAAMAASGVVWHVDVVFPDGTHLTRDFAYDEGGGKWLSTPSFAKLATQIRASTFVSLIRGEIPLYAALFGGIRRVSRVYRVTALGAHRLAQVQDPLVRYFAPTASERFLEHELKMLGV